MWYQVLIFIALLSRPAYMTPVPVLFDWLIPNSSFNTTSDFNTYWNYNYPWGTDHNGAARMNSSQVKIKNGELKLISKPVSGQPPTRGNIAINYISGTVFAKQSIVVNKDGAINVSGKFRAPTEIGTWPAIWLTGERSWPPEIDLAEWKGNGDIFFNCVDVNQYWQSFNTTYVDPNKFHDILVKLRDENGVDVHISYYLDNELQATQTGRQMIGAPFWLIIDYQMEGSSGSPGPNTVTHYSIKEFSVGEFVYSK